MLLVKLANWKRHHSLILTESEDKSVAAEKKRRRDEKRKKAMKDAGEKVRKKLNYSLNHQYIHLVCLVRFLSFPGYSVNAFRGQFSKIYYQSLPFRAV